MASANRTSLGGREGADCAPQTVSLAPPKPLPPSLPVLVTARVAAAAVAQPATTKIALPPAAVEMASVVASVTAVDNSAPSTRWLSRLYVRIYAG